MEESLLFDYAGIKDPSWAEEEEVVVGSSGSGSKAETGEWRVGWIMQ
jgi:hypothetical protein